jgi:hypothetical protein
MDKKRKDGYIAGLGFLFGFAIFLATAISIGWNTSGQMFGIVAVPFGALGFGSLWKPDSIGAFALKLLGKSDEKSDSHDNQVQNKSSGIQAMADRGGQININIVPEKTQGEDNPKSNNQAASVVNKIVKKDEIQKTILLSDTQNITKLNIDNNMLDQIFEKASNQAIQFCHDAKLSKFSIQVSPFRESGTKVTIFLDFYSKFADKIFSFRYSDQFPRVENMRPHKFAKSDYDRIVLENIPWKESPQWAYFLDRAYAKTTPLVPLPEAIYNISAYAFAKPIWRVVFDDGHSGKDRTFSWNGKGLSEDDIKEV